MTPTGKRILVRTTLAVVLLVAAATTVLYLQSSYVPSEYKPLRLSENQRHRAVSDFLATVVNDFGNKARAGESFSVTYTQDQINSYLASIDAIAAIRPSVQYGTIYRLMDRAGLAEPAVHLDDGVLLMMVRSREYEKVISAGLTFTFAPDGSLKIGMSGAWIGQARVPEAMIRNRLNILKNVLESQRERIETASQPSTKAALVGFTTQDIGRMLTAAITAIDEEPIARESLLTKVERNRFRVADLKITEGKITLFFEKILRDAETQPAATPDE